MWNLLKKLGELKKTNSALHGGKNAAAYKSIKEDGNIIAIERNNNGKTLIYLANLSDNPEKISLSREGMFLDYFNNKEMKLEGNEISLGAWEYKILIN